MKAVLIRSALLSGVLALSLAPLAHATSAANQTAVNNGVNYLKGQQAADGKIGTSAANTDWSAVALSAAGLELDTVAAPGGASLRAYLAATAPAAGALATDWERRIIAITADGQNPYDFGGVNYVSNLKAFVSGGQIGSTTAANDDYFGLIALLAARVNASDPAVTNTLSFILTQQHADGGFSYSTDPAIGSDTNDTAAAIMALRAAQIAGLGSVDVANALADAQAYLLGTQNPDGGFPYDPLNPPEWGGNASDTSSTAWVVMALNAVGLGTSSDADDANAYIRAAQHTDGSFPWVAPAAGDVMNSAPAVTALSGGQYPLSIFGGTVPRVGVDEPAQTPTPTPSPSATPTPTPTPTTPGAVLGDDTTATPPAASTGEVLGSSTLPAVGQVSSLLLLELALGISIMTGFGIYALQRRKG